MKIKLIDFGMPEMLTNAFIILQDNKIYKKNCKEHLMFHCSRLNTPLLSTQFGQHNLAGY